MLITIASIELKDPRSVVTTTERKRLGVWTDKVGAFGLEQGGTYEVETESKDFNGRTLTNIVQAKRSTAPAVKQTAAEPMSNGTYQSKDEEIWTAALLKSAIESGQLKYNDKQALWEAGQTFRALRRHLFTDTVLQTTNSGTGVRRVA